MTKIEREFKDAIVLMRGCKVPDASVILNVVDRMNEDQSIFSVAGALTQSGNAIANVYGIFLKHRHNLCSMQAALLPLKIATDMCKHSMSIAWYCYVSAELNQPLSTTKELLEKAMKTGERDAFYVYGKIYKDLQCLKIAFQMGYMCAGKEYAKLSSLMPRIEMLGNMTRVGPFGHDFLYCLNEEISKNEQPSLQAYYLFGKYLQGNIQQLDVSGIVKIFGYVKSGYVAKVAPDMAAWYEKQNAACRAAVDMFSLCALRMKICKDMRIYISKFIWSTREEALY